MPAPGKRNVNKLIYHSTTVSYRVVVGRAFHDWRAAPGAASKAPYADFVRYWFGLQGKKVDSARKMFVKRSSELATKQDKGENVSLCGAPKKRVMHGSLVRSGARRRITCQQGPRPRAGFIREALFDWFVDIRSAVACRIPPKFVLRHAERMADACVKDMARTGCFFPMPKLDRKWLKRWQRDYCVLELSIDPPVRPPPVTPASANPVRAIEGGASAKRGTQPTWHTTHNRAHSTQLVEVTFRKPNKRYKCAWTTLADRVTMTMKNVYFARALIFELFGHDPEIIGLDQTPIYMNEQGSRKDGTLELMGVPEVKLKENCALTRQRVSVLTRCSSWTASALQEGGPPIEVLFKGKTKRVLNNISVPPDVNISLAFAPKGSYRSCNMVDYLEKYLEPWTAERADKGDWKILLLDSYRAHWSEDIERCCWLRGYLVLYHYGNTTGVMQVNDTHVHAPFKRLFVAFEADSFAEKAMRDPGDIGRDRHEANKKRVPTTLLAPSIPPGTIAPLGPQRSLHHRSLPAKQVSPLFYPGKRDRDPRAERQRGYRGVGQDLRGRGLDPLCHGRSNHFPPQGGAPFPLRGEDPGPPRPRPAPPPPPAMKV